MIFAEGHLFGGLRLERIGNFVGRPSPRRVNIGQIRGFRLKEQRLAHVPVGILPTSDGIFGQLDATPIMVHRILAVDFPDRGALVDNIQFSSLTDMQSVWIEPGIHILIIAIVSVCVKNLDGLAADRTDLRGVKRGLEERGVNIGRHAALQIERTGPHAVHVGALRGALIL